MWYQNYEGRYALAVGLKTLGHYSYYKVFLRRLGIKMDGYLKSFMQKKDLSIERKRLYKSQLRVKAILARKRIERMEKGRMEVRKSMAV